MTFHLTWTYWQNSKYEFQELFSECDIIFKNVRDARHSKSHDWLHAELQHVPFMTDADVHSSHVVHSLLSLFSW